MPSTPFSTRSRNAPGVRGDDTSAAGKCLDNHAAETFRPRRQHEQRRLVELCCDAGRGKLLVILELGRHVADQIVHDLPLAPRPDDHESCLRERDGNAPPRGRQSVDVLVCLEHPDKDGDGSRRKRLDGLGDERRKVAVGWKDRRRRLTTHALDETRRESGECPGRIRTSQDELADPIREGSYEAARGRTVESRERPPVSVDLDDHGGRRAGEAPTEESRCSDERICGNDRIRCELLDLAPNPEREPQVEEHAVEGARVRRRTESEAFATGTAPRFRGAQDPVVDHLFDRIPLLCQPVG